jgi:hypothetical protein
VLWMQQREIATTTDLLRRFQGANTDAQFFAALDDVWAFIKKHNLMGTHAVY